MNVFAVRATEFADNRPSLTAAVEPLLKAHEAVERQIADLDRKVLRLARNNAQVRRFMTAPGDAELTARTPPPRAVNREFRCRATRSRDRTSRHEYEFRAISNCPVRTRLIIEPAPARLLLEILATLLPMPSDCGGRKGRFAACGS
jgi:hypothetical protein